MNVPQPIVDAGGIAIVVFLIAAIVYAILKIVQTVKSGSSKNGNGERLPRCYASPIVAQLAATQAQTSHNIEKMETAGAEISQNMALQTSLLARVAAVQERLSELLVKMNARDEARTTTLGRRG
jgi:hypothetical protein